MDHALAYSSTATLKMDEPVLPVAVRSDWNQSHQPYNALLEAKRRFTAQRFDLKGRRGVPVAPSSRDDLAASAVVSTCAA